MDNSNQAMAYRAMGDATIISNNPLLYTDPVDRSADPITILPQGGIYQRTEDRMVSTNFRWYCKLQCNIQQYTHPQYFWRS